MYGNMHYLTIPQDIRNMISDMLNKKANRRLRLACEQLNEEFIEYYTQQRATILRKSTPNKFIKLYRDYKRLHILSPDVSDDDISELNCIELQIQNIHMLGYNFKDTLRILHLCNPIDTEYLEDIYFETLQVVIIEEKELWYLHTEELILRNNGDLITITQEHIDSIGCHTLNLHTRLIFEPDVVLKTLHCWTLPDSLLKETEYDILGLNIQNLSVQAPYKYFFDKSLTFDKLMICSDIIHEQKVDCGVFSEIRESLFLYTTFLDCSSLHHLSHLNEVQISGCFIEEEYLIHLANCDVLSFVSTDITGEYLHELSCSKLSVNNCPNLDPQHLLGKHYETLNASVSNINMMKDYTYIEMKNVPDAKHIDLSGRSEITDYMLTGLRNSVEINISGCSIEGKGLKYLTSCKILHIDYSFFIPEYLCDMDIEEVHFTKSHQQLTFPDDILTDIHVENVKEDLIESVLGVRDIALSAIDFARSEGLNVEEIEGLGNLINITNNVEGVNRDMVVLATHELTNFTAEVVGEDVAQLVNNLMTNLIMENT